MISLKMKAVPLADSDSELEIDDDELVQSRLDMIRGLSDTNQPSKKFKGGIVVSTETEGKEHSTSASLSAAEKKGLKEVEELERELDLKNTFSRETNRRDEDAEMNKYIDEQIRLRRDAAKKERQKLEESKKVDPEESELSEIFTLPAAATDKIDDILLHSLSKNLASTSDERSEAMLSSQMLNGIPEIDLGISEKIRTIEATEEAKLRMASSSSTRHSSRKSSAAPVNFSSNFQQHRCNRANRDGELKTSRTDRHQRNDSNFKTITEAVVVVGQEPDEIEYRLPSTGERPPPRDRKSNQAGNEHSLNQSVDVSHLATPHIASNSSLRLSSNSTPVGDCSSDDSNDRNKYQQQGPLAAAASVGNSSPHNQNQYLSEPPDRREELSDAGINNSVDIAPLQLEHSPLQQQPNATNSPPINIYELQPSQEHQQQQPQPSPRGQEAIVPPPPPIVANPRHIAAGDGQQPDQNGSTAKLSYDIISVREPLAKIMAWRQQVQLSQLQQRQILGEHDYIEVYGERGSSCFYEEIAGSTTSSATYDQIGAISNHNYQVLINAYAVSNRSNQSRQNGEQDDNNNNSNDRNNNNSNDRNNNNDNNNNTVPMNGRNAMNESGAENFYDLTGSGDQVDGPSISNNYIPMPSTSHDTKTNPNQISIKQHAPTSIQPPIPTDRTSTLSQSVPVYSVINKATRRRNAIIRATIDSCRPPQPPPKNLTMVHQPSTSAIQSHQELSTNNCSNNHHQPYGLALRVSPQVPTTSSYQNNKTSDSTESSELKKATRLPQPPPRFSKLHMYNATNRPLPLPDNYDTTVENNEPDIVIDRSLVQDEDIQSLNNGYELLSTNFDDDQIDVGYEKIRESNRYSGGSLTSQFCPLQAIDNGGYESVQPIYSSPSNALAEPNYEAIGPTTASELAAAATARLTAAAAAIEQLLKQDQSGS